MDKKLITPRPGLTISRRRLLQVGAASLITGPSLLAACGGGDDTSSSPNETGGAQGGEPDRSAILRFGQMRGES